MPRPQTPVAKAKLTGAAAKDPQRFRERKEPLTKKQPVGDPPAYLDKEAKAVWRELAKTLGWLEREDRLPLESAAVSVGQVRRLHKEGEIVSGALLAAMNTAIGKLGASPTDRAKVVQSDDKNEDDDPFAKFGVQ